MLAEGSCDEQLPHPYILPHAFDSLQGSFSTFLCRLLHQGDRLCLIIHWGNSLRLLSTPGNKRNCGHTESCRLYGSRV